MVVPRQVHGAAGFTADTPLAYLWSCARWLRVRRWAGQSGSKQTRTRVWAEMRVRVCT